MPSALKIESSTCCVSRPLEQSHVQRQPGAVGYSLEEARDDVGALPPHPRVGEIDVRDEERPARGLESDVGERLVRRYDGRAEPAAFSARRAPASAWPSA